MRPLMLKGHDRALTKVCYNREGDLLFSASKDNVPTCWRAQTGERIGTYDGHQGAVWDMAVSFDSRYLLTASADTHVKLWNLETGEELFSFPQRGPAKSVCWSEGARMFLTVSDPFMGNPPVLSVYAMPQDLSQLSTEPLHEWEQAGKVTTAKFGPFNDYILACGDDGAIRTLDLQDGEEIKEIQPHTGVISSVDFNKDMSLFITAGKDQKAILFNATTLEVLAEYEADRPLNAAAISPIKEHILMGGGQDAMSVTTTAGRAGGFECRIHDMVHTNEIGRIKGHFGPINTLAICPDGHSYASGGEDGYVRLFHFDDDYFDMPDAYPPLSAEEQAELDRVAAEEDAGGNEQKEG